MIHSQNVKRVVLASPGTTVATNATGAYILDTINGNADAAVADIEVYAPNFVSTNASKQAVLALQESDDTVATNFASISGAVGTTNSTASTTEFVIPTGATDTNSEGACVAFNVDLTKRKRYLRVIVTPGADTSVGASARLYSLGDTDSDDQQGDHTSKTTDADVTTVKI